MGPELTLEAGIGEGYLASLHATLAFYQFSGVGPDFETIQVKSQSSSRIVRWFICTSMRWCTVIRGEGTHDLRVGGEVVCTFIMK